MSYIWLPNRSHLDLETTTLPRQYVAPEIGSDTWHAGGKDLIGVDLALDGIENYSKHDATKVYLFSLKFDHYPSQLVILWKRIQLPGGASIWRYKTEAELFAEYPVLLTFFAAVEAGRWVIAHNATFERLVWNRVIRKQYPSFPELKLSQLDCTMARANAMGFPGSLENLALVLNLKNKKMDSRLMKAMASDFNLISEENLWSLGMYCRGDTEAEAEADGKLPLLTPTQRRVWLLDQEINDRGMRFDRPALLAALDLVEAGKALANARIQELTRGEVQTAQQAAALVRWLHKQGHTGLSSVAQFTLQNYERDHGFGDGPVREVLDCREIASRSSTAKIATILELLRLTSDARVRHQYVIFGAHTGRWTARGAQPQNFKRFDEEKDLEVSDALFHALKQVDTSKRGSVSHKMSVKLAAMNIALATGLNPITAISRCMRLFIRAPDGAIFYDADLANIEGRVNAWLAGETSSLDTFRANDEGTGPDVYRVTYSRAFGVPLALITKAMRQRGKVMFLALGYQGGIGAILKMGPTYGMRAKDLVEPIKAAVSQQEWFETLADYPKALDKKGLPPEEWTACKIVIHRWRRANKRISDSWGMLQNALLRAIDSPRTEIILDDYRGVSFYRDGNSLYVTLPSGRRLHYWKPEIRKVQQDVVRLANGNLHPMDAFPNRAEIARLVTAGLAEIVPSYPQRKIVFQGKIDGTTEFEVPGEGSIKIPGWGYKGLYGGLTCENIVQAASYDAQTEKMLALADRGFEICLHTHDSVTSEIRHASDRLLSVYREVMSAPVSWAPDLPIGVKVNAAPYYS